MNAVMIRYLKSVIGRRKYIQFESWINPSIIFKRIFVDEVCRKLRVCSAVAQSPFHDLASHSLVKARHKTLIASYHLMKIKIKVFLFFPMH